MPQHGIPYGRQVQAVLVSLYYISTKQVMFGEWLA
jgi:hypothetical protein